MENATRILAEPSMVRANRKVIAGRCSICDKGFKLAEETYSCPTCGGFHHVACWESHRACPSQNSTPATASSVDEATELVPAPVVDIAEDERRCPSCAKVIQREALKCRFCGHVFDSAYAMVAAEIPRELAAQIESYANKSLITSIIGIFICAPILGPMAISSGRNARRLLSEYPSYRLQTSAGGKALAGIIIGWIGIIGAVLTFFSRFN